MLIKEPSEKVSDHYSPLQTKFFFFILPVSLTSFLEQVLRAWAVQQPVN